MASHILYVTGQSASLYRVDRKRIDKLCTQPCSDAGYAAVCAALLEHEAPPVAVLTDLIEEEFREESLPHTIGRDRATLHARHAGKLFRSTPYRHYRVIDRQKQGRRDDQVLFSALTNRDNIEPLLNALATAGVPVKGVYSLPIVSRHLVKSLGVQNGNVLLVTEQPDGGLRETFVRDGQVRFSRLAPINENSARRYAQILTAEAQKTRRYLHTLRLLGHDQPLDVFALCDSARLEALQQQPNDDGNIRIQGIDLSHLTRLLGLPDSPDTGLSDGLFCYLLHKYRSGNHYARAADLRNWRTHQVRLGMLAASWLIAVGALVLSGMNIVDARLVEREAAKLGELSAQTGHAYEQIEQGLPVQPDAALAMREALDVAGRLKSYPLKIDRLYRLVGSGLSAQPGLALDKFSWFVTPDRDARKPAEVQPGDEPSSLPASPYLVTRISGHVRNFNGDYARVQQQVEYMADWLSKQPGVIGVQVIRKPLNTRADNNLQGGMAVNEDREIAEFELRLVLELNHGTV